MEGREQNSGNRLRREAFEHSDEVGEVVTRQLIAEKIGNPSEKQTRKTLEKITSEVLNPMLEKYTNVETLKKFKEIASKIYGYPLSATHLSASVINSIAAGLSSVAIENFKNNELSSIPIETICASDVCVG